MTSSGQGKLGRLEVAGPGGRWLVLGGVIGRGISSARLGVGVVIICEMLQSPNFNKGDGIQCCVVQWQAIILLLLVNCQQGF